jgi:hypothetical protein
VRSAERIRAKVVARGSARDHEEQRMYRKTLIGGVTAAAIVCAGGTALALSGSESTPGASGTASSTSSGSGGGKQHGLLGRAKALRRLAHGELVIRGKDGFVTHDLIVGTVTAVSSNSITVQAADKTSETFAVTSDTKVRLRSNGNGSASSIDKVADGDHVLVAGIGTSTMTAKHVVDVKGRAVKRAAVVGS